MQSIITFVSVISLAISFLNAAPMKSGRAAADLLLKHTSVPAGGSTVVALHLMPDAGWHTYWQNPGASGMPTSIKWELPEGVTVSDLQFPAPHVFDSFGIKSLGYEGEVMLLAELNISEDVMPGELEITGSASWLTCVAEACIPGDAKLKVSLKILPAGESAVAGNSADLITKAQTKLPQEPKDWSASYRRMGNALELQIKPAQGLKLDTTHLNVFVVQQSVVEDAGKVTWTIADGGIIGQMAVSKYLNMLPDRLDIVLVGAGIESGVKISSKMQK